MRNSSTFFVVSFLGIILVLFTACDKDSPTSGNDTSVEIPMVTIPGGSFQMGSDWENDPENPLAGNSLFINEQPIHSVNLDSFEMSITEITQEQYTAVMGRNPSFHEGLNLPVEQVSWNDAVEFCNALSKLTGLQPCYYEETVFTNKDTFKCDFSKNGYRLPTEAEWEYACRAGTTTLFYTGDESSDIGEFAWYQANSHNITYSVGLKATNAFGLYDMLGNVAEWCNDWYDEDYYNSSENKNPSGPIEPKSFKRIVRGGSFGNDVLVLRSAVRGGIDPRLMLNSIGFRVVKNH